MDEVGGSEAPKKRYSPESLAKQAAKESEWRAILEDWRRSGLDGRSYAKLKGISEHLFYSWKRTIRLRDEATEAESQPSRPPKPSTPSKTKTRKGNSKPSSLFLPVSLKSSGSLELRHSSGHVLVVHEGCCPELLRLTLSALDD